MRSLGPHSEAAGINEGTNLSKNEVAINAENFTNGLVLEISCFFSRKTVITEVIIFTFVANKTS